MDMVQLCTRGVNSVSQDVFQIADFVVRCHPILEMHVSNPEISSVCKLMYSTPMHKAVAHGLQPCLHFKNGSQPLSHALRLVAGVSLGPNLRVAIDEAREALDNFAVTGRLTVLPLFSAHACPRLHIQTRRTCTCMI